MKCIPLFVMVSFLGCEIANPLQSSFLGQHVLDPFEMALQQAKEYRRLGQWVNASRSFQKAADEANQAGKYGQEAEALVAKTGCEIRLFHYSSALRSAQAAKTFALRVNDRTYAGAATTNLSVIYSQLGDFLAAGLAASESVNLLAQSTRRDYYALALANKGESDFGLHQAKSGLESFQKAIAAAKGAKLPLLEAVVSDHLGTWMMLEGQLREAEVALLHAQEIFKSQEDKDGLAGSYEHIAELEWRKGGVFLRPALAHINLAFSTKSEAFKTSPQYYPIHIRGQILLSLGQKEAALAEFRRSVNAADTWRQSALPGDSTNTQTVVQLDSVYTGFAHLAAELALERDDHLLAREAFEILARNRAASLREQLTRSYSGKLLDSPDYFDLIQRLQTAQASATLGDDPEKTARDREQLNQIRAKLSELENRIGLSKQYFSHIPDRRGKRNPLREIQSRLSDSEALLSISLGYSKSFLWAVTREDVKLYDLPRRDIIERQAALFSRAVESNTPERVESSRALSRALFSTIAPSIKRKADWLITLDGALLEKMPLAALSRIFEGTDESLVASHSLRIIPTASLLLEVAQPTPSGGFIGVGDPIYNRADSRRDHTRPNATTNNLKIGVPSVTLGRLVASGVEIKTSAEKCGLSKIRLLTGKDASGIFLRRVVDQQTPQILHFAVHVISPKNFPQEAALALSLTEDGLPELLTAETVVTYHVSGSLVILSGCSSQQGEVLPGAGLIGLSRGWLLAGAAAVIVSAWPTPDSSGTFFQTFYTHYRSASGSLARRAARALQETQIDMQRRPGYEREPKFWAAYSVLSKE